MNVYVLIRNEWVGSHYNTKVIEVFDSQEKAIDVMEFCWNHHKSRDVEHEIIEVPFMRTET